MDSLGHNEEIESDFDCQLIDKFKQSISLRDGRYCARGHCRLINQRLCRRNYIFTDESGQVHIRPCGRKGSTKDLGLTERSR